MCIIYCTMKNSSEEISSRAVPAYVLFLSSTKIVIKLNYCVNLNFFSLSGSLQISESKESDEGKYECVAENAAGVVYSYAANLYVRGKK